MDRHKDSPERKQQVNEAMSRYREKKKGNYVAIYKAKTKPWTDEFGRKRNMTYEEMLKLDAARRGIPYKKPKVAKILGIL